MGSHGEALLHPCATAATVLAGIGRWHGDDATASVCCFAFEDGPKLRPARITDALGKVGVAYQVSYLHIFEIDGVERSQQTERCLVVEVAPLPLDFLVFSREKLHGFSARSSTSCKTWECTSVYSG
jgi:hypothetical protein